MTNQEIQVQMPPDLDPVYSNMIQIAFKDDEFTFLFLHQIPGTNQARTKAVVSISPRHAKSLLAVLGRSMGEYEEKFGPLDAPPDRPTEGVTTTLSGYS
ncbi:MAG: DUF3467 domain-containing protein [Methanospirillum sp.]|nr:DUF3467 domain-containing protein [Methanospirillum sp.]